jgi:putative hemolysin
MQKIDLKKIISDRSKDIAESRILRNKLALIVLKKILYIEKINLFIDLNSHLDTVHFINELFEYLNFSYLISSKDIERIPAEGKLICVANHPIGSLDGLSLLKAFIEIRPDVKIIANDVLYYFDFIKPYLLPVDLFNSKTAQRDYITTIKTALEKENAVIIFPAATVSRLKWYHIMDSEWHKGAVSLARKFNAPVLPVFIDAKNSLLFYIVSLLSKKTSMLLLAHELFNKRNKSIRIKIGNMIPARAFKFSYINDFYQTKLLKKHVYLMGKRNRTVYSTEKNIIHPVDRRFIKRELNNSELLGISKEGMQIYLVQKETSPFCINEVARLRETTFRKVGEGTGKKLDIDKFDGMYSHLIVWDDKELEIVGSYRLGIGKKIHPYFGTQGFYTSTLFNFSKNFELNFLKDSIELGRSFVQKKYWNTNALNYLWQGIGAFLSGNPDAKYLFGGVSISNSYPEYAKKLIVYYYTKWFSNREHLIESKNRFMISKEEEN